MTPLSIAPAALPFPAVSTVCHCFQISEREILAAINDGASSVAEVLAATNSAGGCGGCAYSIERMLQGLPPYSFRCARCGYPSFVCECEAVRAGLSPEI